MKNVDLKDCNHSVDTIRRYLVETLRKAKEYELSESYIHKIEIMLDDLEKLYIDINFHI